MWYVEVGNRLVIRVAVAHAGPGSAKRLFASRDILSIGADITGGYYTYMNTYIPIYTVCQNHRQLYDAVKLLLPLWYSNA